MSETNRTIAFFSSDARKLYKDDIFRVLALPTGYIIHFRYQKKYVEKSLYENRDSLKGRPGMIFFTVGNSIQQEGPKLFKNISIRKVEVEDCFYDENTELVHFYLKVGYFTNSVIKCNSTEIIPDKYFAVECEINDKEENNWFEKVSEVKDYFGDIAFYNIQILKKGFNSVEELSAKYIKHEKQSYYMLNDGENYILKLGIYDNSNGESFIKVSEDAGLLALGAPKTIAIGAPKDTRHYKIITHTLDIRNITTFIRMISEPKSVANKENSELSYEVSVGIDISKGFVKPLIFGLLSVMALLGTGLLAIAINSVTKEEKVILPLFIISTFMLFISAFGLYRFYNKK